MYIFDRYIAKHTFSGYCFLLLVFIGLYFIVDLFSNLNDMLQAKPPIGALIGYYAYMVPLIFLRVSSFAFLVSVLYTYGELNKHNEILTMRASGMSVFRVSLPVLAFALLLSAATFFIQERVLLYSQKKVDDIKVKFIKKNFSAPEEGNFAFHSKDMILFTSKFIPKNKLLQDVIVFKEDSEGNITQKTIAQSITYKDSVWMAQNVIEYALDTEGNIVGTPTHSAEKRVDIEEKPEELALKKSILTQFASLKDLRKEIKKLSKIKAYNKLSNLVIDAYNKIADPFAHLFLVIGILPFALEIKKRKVALSSLGIGFIFWFLYYYVASLSTALGKTGIILPICSPWIGPLFFVTVGITGLLLIR